LVAISIFYFDIPEEAALVAFLHGAFWSFSADEIDFGGLRRNSGKR
jgi:hypothetical protein